MDYVTEFLELGRNNSENRSFNGRVMAKRDFGKIIFMTLKDQSGSMQIAFQKNTLEDSFQRYGEINVGDIIEVTGTPFKTKKGTKTLNVSKGKIVSSCLVPFPDKYNGLSRKNGQQNRGLELAINDSTMSLFRRRNDIMRELRQFLYKENFQEVDTGILQPVTNTSMSSEFKTYSNFFNRDLFLRKTPELRLKQLLVGGLENIFEIGKNFRNEGISKVYHPEFTILELYKNRANYKDVLDLTIRLLTHLNEMVYCPSSNPTEVEQIYLYDFISSQTGINPHAATIDKLKSAIDPTILKKYEGNEENIKGLYIYDVFRTLLKKHSDRNLVLHGIPKEISVLGKTFDDEPSLVEEFRYFVKGNIICNGITELTDYKEQERRIEQQARTFGKTLDRNDDQFLELLKIGLPPCAGIGLGLEKTLMVYLETDDIRDVIYYPL